MRRFVLLATMGALAMTGCATTARTGRGDARIDIIAHRGASAKAPENTLAAFRLAHDLRADWFELDCTLTSDGEVVCIHDGTVDRTTNATGEVAKMTLADLKQLDAGAWKHPDYAGEPLPTLAEALDFARGDIGVYIEIKNSAGDAALEQAILDCTRDVPVLSRAQGDAVRALIAESGSRNHELTRKSSTSMRERNMEKHVVIQSFSPICCAVAKLTAPDLRVEFSADSIPPSTTNGRTAPAGCFSSDWMVGTPTPKALRPAASPPCRLPAVASPYGPWTTSTPCAASRLSASMPSPTGRTPPCASSRKSTGADRAPGVRSGDLADGRSQDSTFDSRRCLRTPPPPFGLIGSVDPRDQCRNPSASSSGVMCRGTKLTSYSAGMPGIGLQQPFLQQPGVQRRAGKRRQHRQFGRRTAPSHGRIGTPSKQSSPWASMPNTKQPSTVMCRAPRSSGWPPPRPAMNALPVALQFQARRSSGDGLSNPISN